MDTNGDIKNLLIKDISSRLPYGVKVTWDNKHPLTVTPHIYCAIASENKTDNFPKLLLRSMSSMTKEERKIYAKLLFADLGGVLEDYYKSLDYLNSIHIDYRGLIEKGLAIEVTKENNPYKE